MTPCHNLSRHDPDIGRIGDCHRCCVAAILDLPPGDVPHFAQIEHETGRPWLETQGEWLASHGLSYARFPYGGDVPLEQILEATAVNCAGLPLILGGASKKSPNHGHSVVIMDGQIVMDPSGSGIGGPLDGVWMVELIGIGADWGGRTWKLAA